MFKKLYVVTVLSSAITIAACPGPDGRGEGYAALSHEGYQWGEEQHSGSSSSSSSASSSSSSASGTPSQTRFVCPEPVDPVALAARLATLRVSQQVQTVVPQDQ